MRLAARADDRALNEVFGFVVRCALQSAGHMTDYVVEEGTARMLGGERADVLVALACEAGLMKRRTKRAGGGYELVQDPEFLHIRLRADVEWERQRKRDAANPALTVAVRLRDGDACRYCLDVVNWRQRRGKRRGTYDHREPGKAATVDTYVVACHGCQIARSDDPKADERVPLQPPPANPHYGDDTRELFAHHADLVASFHARAARQAAHARPTGRDPHERSPQPTRPGSQPDHAQEHQHYEYALRDPADGGLPRDMPATSARQPTDTRSASPPMSPQVSTPADLQIPADPRSSARVGSGRVGLPAPPAPTPARPPRPADPPRRRGRRGRRGAQ